MSLLLAAVLPVGASGQVSRFRTVANPVPEHYIVILKPGAVVDIPGGVASHAARLGTARGGIVGHIYERWPKGFSVRLSAVEALAISNDPAVAWVQEDGYVAGAFSQASPGWALDRIDQRLLPLDGYYTYALVGVGVHVYDVDSGIRATHSEFGGRVYGGIDFVNDGYGTADCFNHGTPASAIMGGTTYGVAKSVLLHPVRVLDCTNQATWGNFIAAVNWVAANHVKPAVALLNVVGDAYDAADAAVQDLIDAGVTVVVPAGNAAADACLYSPARVADALTVAGSDSSDSVYFASSQGACVDVFAPSVNVLSAANTSDSAFQYYTGTSFSGPYAAGVAALYLAGHPQAGPAEVAGAVASQATVGALTGVWTGTPNKLLYAAFSTCQTGLTNCSGACVDVLTDRYNCGTCGFQCMWGCEAGACKDRSCPLGTIDCCGDGGCMTPQVCAKLYPLGC